MELSWRVAFCHLTSLLISRHTQHAHTYGYPFVLDVEFIHSSTFRFVCLIPHEYTDADAGRHIFSKWITSKMAAGAVYLQYSFRATLPGRYCATRLSNINDMKGYSRFFHVIQQQNDDGTLCNICEK